MRESTKKPKRRIRKPRPITDDEHDLDALASGNGDDAPKESK